MPNGRSVRKEWNVVCRLTANNANNLPAMQFLIGVPRTSQSKCDIHVWYYWLSVLGKGPGSHNYPLSVEQFITWLLSIYRFVNWRVKQKRNSAESSLLPFHVPLGRFVDFGTLANHWPDYNRICQDYISKQIQYLCSILIWKGEILLVAWAVLLDDSWVIQLEPVCLL